MHESCQWKLLARPRAMSAMTSCSAPLDIAVANNTFGFLLKACRQRKLQTVPETAKTPMPNVASNPIIYDMANVQTPDQDSIRQSHEKSAPWLVTTARPNHWSRLQNALP